MNCINELQCMGTSSRSLSELNMSTTTNNGAAACGGSANAPILIGDAPIRAACRGKRRAKDGESQSGGSKKSKPTVKVASTASTPPMSDNALFAKLQSEERASVSRIEATRNTVQNAVAQIRATLGRVQVDSTQLRSAMAHGTAITIDEIVARLQSNVAATVRDAANLEYRVKCDTVNVTQLKYNLDTIHQFYVDSSINQQSENAIEQGRLRNQVNKLQSCVINLRRQLQAKETEVDRQRQLMDSERDRLLEQLNRWREYHRVNMQVQRNYIRSVIDIYQRHIGVGQRAVDVAVAALTENDFAMPTTSVEASLEKVFIHTHPLTSVSVIHRLPKDVHPLISSFLCSGSLDVAVIKKATHIVNLLVANGATATHSTAQLAVKSGNVDVVRSVFQAIPRDHITPQLLRSLPIQDHAVGQWIMQQFSSEMATEYMGLRATFPLAPETRVDWLMNQIERQWQWEKDISNDNYARRRKLFNGAK